MHGNQARKRGAFEDLVRPARTSWQRVISSSYHHARIILQHFARAIYLGQRYVWKMASWQKLFTCSWLVSELNVESNKLDCPMVNKTYQRHRKVLGEGTGWVIHSEGEILHHSITSGGDGSSSIHMLDRPMAQSKEIPIHYSHILLLDRPRARSRIHYSHILPLDTDCVAV